MEMRLWTSLGQTTSTCNDLAGCLGHSNMPSSQHLYIVNYFLYSLGLWILKLIFASICLLKKKKILFKNYFIGVDQDWKGRCEMALLWQFFLCVSLVLLFLDDGFCGVILVHGDCLLSPMSLARLLLVHWV